MNLRAIANGVTRAVNPNMTATLMLNNGYKTDEAGVRTADYESETVTIPDTKPKQSGAARV